MTDKRTFLAHFVICLACAAAVFFATLYGVPQLIWQSDLSHMTSVIAALFVGSALYLGWLAWRLSPSTASAILAKAEYGHFIEEKFLRLGILGTVIGLSLQAKALAAGTDGLMPLATAMMCTATGVLASLLMSVLAFNITAGCEEMGR